MGRPSLSGKLSEQILTEYGPSGLLPSERELAMRYGCSRLTLRKALHLLHDSGLVASAPRNGHFFTETGKETLFQSQRFMPNIMLFSMEERLRDPAHTYMIGGAIHQARLNHVNLVVRELADGENNFSPLRGHVDADGYIIAGAAPSALVDTLAAEGKPCVVLGLLYEQDDIPAKLCCQQLLLGTTHIYREVGRHLRSLNHRRIMVAYTYGESHDIVEAIRSAFADLPPGEVTIEPFCPPLMRQERTPETLRHAALETVRKLNQYTALVIPEGHIYALEIIRQMQLHHIRFPEDVSLVIQGCETDWFLDSYQISSVYAEYRDQGMACIRELLRQLHNGRREAGVRYTPAQYIMRQSTGPAPVPSEVVSRNE
ncbi:GntR family transcriptional regulator [uncultured Victivallis sp.]|uniref:GntR family transcriptional regulator n=1 Tax=uncultured Victivallis sp. TaxID=354118 RepID=UPI0025FC845D|nr:GntR family transcriptional regulator [uncultured Victivallis sp.]